MKLLCQAAHVYQERCFVAGEVYDLADDIAARLLHDYGPMAEGDTRGGHEVRFVVAPAEMADEAVVSPETEIAPAEAEKAAPKRQRSKPGTSKPKTHKER